MALISSHLGAPLAPIPPTNLTSNLMEKLMWNSRARSSIWGGLTGAGASGSRLVPRHRSDGLCKRREEWCYYSTKAREFRGSRQVRVRSAICSALEGGEMGNDGKAERRGLYDKFLEHAVRAVGRCTDLTPLPCQDEFSNMVAVDGQSVINNVAFESTKFRLFRCATIDGGENMQVLNVAICARPEYDLPIFCADFFSTVSRNIVVLDLNPLYNTQLRPDYRDKYYSPILPLGQKFVELLPWGDKLTAESLQFFSPIVIWTRPDSRSDIQETVFSAFQEYLAAWLQMAETAQPSEDAKEIAANRESHHRYLVWRATKDPGRFVLMRLFGEALCERYITEFLFNGVRTLGTKEFLDYFPEYRGEDGSIIKQRSVVGKSYAERPWNSQGIFSPSA